MPERNGITPSYEQRTFSNEEKRGQLRLIASRDGAQGSVTIHQDARLYSTLLDNDEAVEYPLATDRCVYLHLARGQAKLNGQELKAGDGATIRGESIRLEGVEGAEALLFDLAA